MLCAYMYIHLWGKITRNMNNIQIRYDGTSCIASHIKMILMVLIIIMMNGSFLLPYQMNIMFFGIHIIPIFMYKKHFRIIFLRLIKQIKIIKGNASDFKYKWKRYLQLIISNENSICDI